MDFIIIKKFLIINLIATYLSVLTLKSSPPPFALLAMAVHENKQ